MSKSFHGLMVFTVTMFLFASTSFADPDLAGSISLSLVDSPASLLGLDLKALEWAVCGNPNGEIIRGTVIVIANDGGGNLGYRSRLAVEVLEQNTGPLEGMVFASVRPILFELLGGAVVTLSCGTFTYKVLLDDEVVQPISILTLIGLVGDDRTGTYGTCAGNLAIEARLYLTRVGRPFETLNFPRSLTLQIAGHWALLARPGAEGVSPLLLLADQVGGKLVPSSACLSGIDDLGTSLCFAGEVPAERP
ncbi:MAG TPA: hypothetical protein VGS22_00825 [Thermoanaerobaculia bacterium]|jgi:hypothetical protein|nr:hypothetical protein [Thermoanaerobaculia bacterium]